MNSFSHIILGKIYWPIDMLFWVVGLLFVYIPFVKYYATKEINKLFNFLYVFIFLAIGVLASVIWLWLIVDFFVIISRYPLTQVIFWTLVSLIFLLFVFFENFVRKIFSYKSI